MATDFLSNDPDAPPPLRTLGATQAYAACMAEAFAVAVVAVRDMQNDPPADRLQQLREAVESHLKNLDGTYFPYGDQALGIAAALHAVNQAFIRAQS